MPEYTYTQKDSKDTSKQYRFETVVAHRVGHRTFVCSHRAVKNKNRNTGKIWMNLGQTEKTSYRKI